jgi:iron-sulfur cluster repair protein YtfE (RIC family)
MLRDPNLIPLSHQHQHALALCVRIERARLADSTELHAWHQEIDQHFQQEIQYHFAAEEAVVFPAAQRFRELVVLVAQLVEEHRTLREDFAQAREGALTPERLREFAARLSAHIRKEERQLFEELQRRLSSAEIVELGERLKEALRAVDASCTLPNEYTRLRPRSDS